MVLYIYTYVLILVLSFSLYYTMQCVTINPVFTYIMYNVSIVNINKFSERRLFIRWLEERIYVLGGWNLTG